MLNFSFPHVSKSLVTALVLCAVTTLAQAAKPAIHGEAPNLVRAIAADAPSNENGVIRSRPIALELSALKNIRATTNKPQSIRIGFFDDAALNIQITRTESFGKIGTAYIGTVPGSAFSSAVIVEENGVVSGNINMLDKKYQIRSTADGGHVAREIDAKAFPPDHPTDVVRQAHHERNQQTPVRPEPVKGLNQRSLSAKASAPPEAAIHTNDSGALIDVMVVYTPSARISEGGTLGMLSRINLVVAETNAVYANSNVVQRIRLVYAGEVNYVETDLTTDRNRLQSFSDGIIDEVHALRNLYGADLVSLWGNYPFIGGCGQSNIMTNEDLGFDTQAFTVVDRNCAGSNLSFAHEIGHNMGLLHEDATAHTIVTPENSAVPTDINYARGYADSGQQFFTVMAIGATCSPCTRIPYFSNPAVTFSGAATGDATANAHQALNDTRDTTANFRDSTSVNLNGPGAIVFSPATYSVAENVGTVTISATRHAGSTGTVSVHYSPTGGNATPNVDYDSLSANGVLNWADGESGAKTFALTILPTVAVSSPTLTISLDTPTGGVSIGAAGFSASATINISDSPQTGPAQITSPAPPNGFLNIPYSYKVVASGAPTILYQLSPPETLPTGLTLGLNTGIISGIPSELRTFIGFIRASNPPGNIGYSQQQFSITIVGAPPTPPTITSAIVGQTQTSITFTPSASQGSAPITKYTAICNPGAHSVDTQISPVDVTGLLNDTQYTCGVSATNTYGTVVSTTLLVTPIANAPPALVAVKSRKIHGATGAQFLSIDASALIGGAISIEPRGGGSTGHTVVFYFNGTVNSIGIVTARDSIGTDVGTVSASRVGNTVEVTLLGVPDNKRVTISIPGVNGSMTPFTASLGFLVGDLNGNGAVNASDISAVKTHANQTTIETNAKFDVNASGTIDAADVSAVKARSGLVLPAS